MSKLNESKQKIFAELNQLLADMNISAKVVIGGSAAKEELTKLSDVDCYLITSNFSNWWKILQFKSELREVKQNFEFDLDLIVLPKIILEYGFYYCFGIDQEKNFYRYPIAEKRGQINALKSAYSNRGKIIFGKDDQRWYHYNKSLNHTLWSLVLGNQVEFDQKNLFSKEKLLDLLDQKNFCFNKEKVKQVLSKKSFQEEDVRLLDDLLNLAYEFFQKLSLSIRSYFIYQIFYLRLGQTWQLINPDKKVIKNYRIAIKNKDKEKFLRSEQRKICIPII